MIRAYSVLVVVETARKIDHQRLDAIVAAVVERSTAREAIATGIDGAGISVRSIGLGTPTPLPR